jgi:hypothetical protein
MSSQKRTCWPFPIVNEPREKKSSFTPMSPFQKGESVGFVVTCDKVLFLRYLLCKSSCQTPSSLRSLYNHLLNNYNQNRSDDWLQQTQMATTMQGTGPGCMHGLLSPLLSIGDFIILYNHHTKRLGSKEAKTRYYARAWVIRKSTQHQAARIFS